MELILTKKQHNQIKFFYTKVRRARDEFNGATGNRKTFDHAAWLIYFEAKERARDYLCSCISNVSVLVPSEFWHHAHNETLAAALETSWKKKDEIQRTKQEELTYEETKPKPKKGKKKK